MRISANTGIPPSNSSKNIAFGVFIVASLLAAYGFAFVMNVGSNTIAGVVVFFPITYILICGGLIGLGAFLRSRLTVAGLLVVAALYVVTGLGLYINYTVQRSIHDKRQAQKYVVDIPVYSLSQEPPGYYLLGGKWTTSATTSDVHSPAYIKVAHAIYQNHQDGSKLFRIDEFSGAGHNPPEQCNYDPEYTAITHAKLPACERFSTMPSGEPIWHYPKESGAGARDYLMTKIANTNVSMMVYLSNPDFTLEEYANILKTLRTTPTRN